MQVVIFVMTLIAFPAMATESDVAVQDSEKDEKNRPVSKVIALLKDMVQQLQKEGEDDEEVYETMGCWCVTNEKSKTKSIADAETKIETLSASIESLTAQSAELNTKISNLDAQIKQSTEALETARALREKESAEFAAMEKEALVNINQLRAGTQALSKLHSAALLKQKSKVTQKLDDSDSAKGSFVNKFKSIDKFQEIEEEALTKPLHHIDGIEDRYVPDIAHACMEVTSSDTFQSVALAQSSHKPIRRVRHSYHDYHPTKLPVHIQSLLCKVFHGTDSAFIESQIEDSQTSSTQYEPASGAIFGILKQMQESFESNLAQAQKAEATASDEFDQLKAAKEKEITASTDLMNNKEDELAMTDEKNAEDKEMLEDTEASLAADTAFLADLKERCASMDAEFEARTKARQMEIEAVSKALAFLNSDEAHDLFTRTFNPGFLQVSSKDTRRLALARMLRSTALKAKDARMLRLASDVFKSALAKAGDNPAFDKVKQEVNELVDKLKKEQRDEMVKKDYCVDALNTNERDMGMKERDKTDYIALIEDLKNTIETLDKDVELLKTEIADLEVQLKRASQNREKENAEFQTTVADQRATAKLLAASLKILADFYKHQALLQSNQKGQKTVVGQAPPPGFKTFEKNAASGGVMGMMQGIIDDAKAMEAECIRAEEKAQKDYENFTKDTTDSIDKKNTEIETKTEDKAKAEQDLVQAKKDLDATITELENLYNEEADLHKECDFLIENFEISQAAREEEMESLKQANQIFSGASFQLFLQSHPEK